MKNPVAIATGFKVLIQKLHKNENNFKNRYFAVFMNKIENIRKFFIIIPNGQIFQNMEF